MPQDATKYDPIAPTYSNAGTTKTLLVEDEDSTRRALASALRQRGMHVLEAATISDALDALDEFGDSLDLAILDYFLPPGEARKPWCRIAMKRTVAPLTAEIITDAMMNLQIGAAILFITAHSREAMCPVLQRTRAFACLHKPFSAGVFLNAVDHLLHWHHDRTGLLETLVSTERPLKLREGVFRAALSLANLTPEHSDEMTRVLRAAIDGLELDVACKACGMSRSKYKRKKAELREALGVVNFSGDLLRRIDQAVAEGELEPFRTSPPSPRHGAQ